jgi:hypothetical protein
MSGRWWWVASLIVLCCIGSRVVSAEDDGKAAAPRWLNDWEEARKAARVSGKPLFVVFRCEH